MAREEKLILPGNLCVLDYHRDRTITSEALVDPQTLTPGDVLQYIGQSINEFGQSRRGGLRRNLVTRQGLALASILISENGFSVWNAVFYFRSFIDVEAEDIMGLSTVLTRTEPGGLVRSQYLPRFRELFEVALSYLGQDNPINGVKGVWKRPTRDSESTNYVIFRKATRDKLPPDLAALSTPQGRVVSRYGFGRVEFKTDPKKGEEVEVLFRR